MSPRVDPDFQKRQAFDATYAWWRPRLMLVAALLPAILLFPLWGWLRETLGPEGAALVAIVAQMACMVAIPDRAAYAIAKRRSAK